jgi:hypothetical protein
MTTADDHPLLGFLPPALRAEVLDLAAARYDDAVSDEEWQRRARALTDRAAAMPPAIRDAFSRLIRHYAALERAAESTTPVSTTAAQVPPLESEGPARTV